MYDVTNYGNLFPLPVASRVGCVLGRGEYNYSVFKQLLYNRLV